jgi:hypothetical protein
MLDVDTMERMKSIGEVVDVQSTYAKLSERIKLRIDEARSLLYGEAMDERDVLYATLQLRLSIEEIACASLVANRSAFEDRRQVFRLRKFEHVQKALKSISHEYWPKGVSEEGPYQNGKPTVWNSSPEALSSSDWMRMWGKLSESLHMQNPWDHSRDLTADLGFARDVHSKLVATLSSHVVKIAGGNQLVMARFWASPIQVYVFESVEE